MPYSQELRILENAGLLRRKTLPSPQVSDYASNDYLGLASLKAPLNQTFRELKRFPIHAPTASLAINGYHPIHQAFESFLISYFGFPSCTLFGSGFLANLALFDTLVRKKDRIFIDELYHASGRYPAKMLGKQAVFFAHNNPQDLLEKIKTHPCRGRILIAIEGVYSMDGDIASADFAHIAKEKEALLIVDEAHSSGVIGEKLKGYFDHHRLPIEENFIKMGTLSKAYGSYGAFVMGAKSVIDFLFSKAKSSIYTTAPSLFDIALAHQNLLYLQAHTPRFLSKLHSQKEIVSKLLNKSLESQLLILPFQKQDCMLRLAEEFLEQGFLVGAIRKPTVQSPRLRISLNLKNSKTQTKKLCRILQNALGYLDA